eukprot:c19734_g1_i1.p2 GENE.c19734_g1_i1~~c19734_g1_i1.p2  ORF type:complete len:271 (+),score=67.60 c19734_g1_i1:1072-1884(+)
MVNQLDHLSNAERTWKLPANLCLTQSRSNPAKDSNAPTVGAQLLKAQLLAQFSVTPQDSYQQKLLDGEDQSGEGGDGASDEDTPNRRLKRHGRRGPTTNNTDAKQKGTTLTNQWGKECDLDRVRNLAEFQFTALMHAFKFPEVVRVSYSTCSIYDEENELVVKRVLEAQSDFHLVPALPDFPFRGKAALVQNGEHCVRSSPEEGGTIGFFVALFERGTNDNVCLKNLTPKEQPNVSVIDPTLTGRAKKNKKRRESLKDRAKSTKRRKVKS